LAMRSSGVNDSPMCSPALQFGAALLFEQRYLYTGARTIPRAPQLLPNLHPILPSAP
jgi:hypothetical protein